MLKKNGSIGMLGRYGLATVATASVSGAHLLAQLAVLHSLGSAEFGLVAFMLTLMQFGAGVCNAMVAAPYTVLINQDGVSNEAIRSLFLVNAGLALCSGALAGVTVLLLDSDALHAAIWFSAASALFTVRWFARTEAYATGRTAAAAASDMLYSLAILCGLAYLWFSGLGLAHIAFLFALAGAAGMGPLARPIAIRSLPRRWAKAFGAYRTIWQTQAKWAVAGLVTTEATSNAHAYVVTAFAGPVAYAPIAAAMLFLRPVGVCMVSLTQIERPVIARSLAANDIPAARRSVLRFTSVLLLMWGATIAAIAFLWAFFPALILKPGMDAGPVLISFFLWATVCLVQCIQTPLNVSLQAAARFRELAFASLQSSILTILTVPALLALFGPVLSTAGVLMGQVLMTGLIAISSMRARLSIAGEMYRGAVGK